MADISDFTRNQGTTRCSKGRRPSNGAARRIKDYEKQLRDAQRKVADLKRERSQLEKEIAAQELAEDQFDELDALRGDFTRIFNDLDGRPGDRRLPFAVRLEIEELFVRLGWRVPW